MIESFQQGAKRLGDKVHQLYDSPNSNVQDYHGSLLRYVPVYGKFSSRIVRSERIYICSALTRRIPRRKRDVDG